MTYQPEPPPPRAGVYNPHTDPDYAARILTAGLIAAEHGDDPRTVFTDMEKAGSAQLAASDLVPADGAQHLEKMGAVLGEQTPGDPLFRRAVLPPGWRKTTTDHDMYVAVVDEHGTERATIFYRAAAYDRQAWVRPAAPPPGN